MSKRTRARKDVVAGLCQSAGQAIGRGDWARAQAILEGVVAMGVVDPHVYNNLATLYDRQGVRQDESSRLVLQAYQLAPHDPNIRKNYLSTLDRQIATAMGAQRFDEAIPILRKKAAADPESAVTQYGLGHCYAQMGDLQTAILFYTRAINLDPNEAAYYNDLGLACYDLQLLAEAKGAFQEVLRLLPNSAPAYVHLGLLANLTGLPAIAVNMMRRAVEVDPDCAAAHNDLAMLLREQGLQSECREHYLRAMALKPESSEIISGYLLSLNDDPHADPAWVAAEHKRFQESIKEPPRRVAAVDLRPERRLRVAYLSPDFRQHSVGHFIGGLLCAHDRSKVEVTCYSTSNSDDEVTDGIRKASDRWRNVFRRSDDELAQTVAQDEIDVLVELSGHTKDNRLRMLARRVAPVQMTYLGYPNTTGLTEMDYRITDAIADPPGLSEAWHSERLLRIEGGFLAFQPMAWAADVPAVVDPAAETGAFTFGSFNNLGKINELVLETWAAILAGAPGSVLILKAKGLGDERTQERLRQAFCARGVDAEKRLTLLGHERSGVEHLRVYNKVDLALDTFPYNGTTTTCEALWMETPVLTLAGTSHAGRVGASILSRVGLGGLVCPTRDAYVEAAVAYASDRARLTPLRQGLRERLAASPVMDAKRLAEGLEMGYAMAWREYCESLAGPRREAASSR